MLPSGQDPDTFIRAHGGAAYQEALRNSRQYLEYLLDRAAADHDLRKDDERREFLGRMLTVAARIPDAAARDQFADRLAHKARITEEVVRAEIRKAAVQQGDGHRTAPRARARPGESLRTGADLGPGPGSRGRFRRPRRSRGHGSERTGDRADSRTGAISAGMAVRGLTTGPAGASKYHWKPGWSPKSPRSRSPRSWSPPIVSRSFGGCSWHGNGPTSSARWNDSWSRAFPAVTSGSTSWGCGSWLSSSR